MSTHFPDSDTLRTALALAIRAPSVHNVQPWRWMVGAASLHLYSDPALHLVHTDPDGRDAMVSCGAALNHGVVALAALGWAGKVHRFPNPVEPTHLASIELQPYAAGEVDVALAAAIPRRRTDRRYFSGWPVAYTDVALMGMRAARAGITMRRVDPSTQLRATLTKAAWQHAAVGPALAQHPALEPTDDHGVLVALGTSKDDDLSRLRAGEATSLVLLTATALGMASCPVTEVLEVGETRDVVREDAFDGDQFPQTLVRVGWAPINADPLPSTPRRPLGDVVFRLDGARRA